MTKTRKTPSKLQGDTAIDNPSIGKFIVVSQFVDRDNFIKTWKEGDDVSHFDESRLQSAIKRGLVKKG